MSFEHFTLSEIKDGLSQSLDLKEYLSVSQKACSALEECLFTLTPIDLESSISDRALSGIPYVISDDICTKGVRTTCGSKMLRDFVPAYGATVCERLDRNFMAGKSAVLEFSCGESTEPELSEKADKFDCAAAEVVAAGGAGFALVTDGNASRGHAASAGLVAMKPTYGAVSRYGVVGLGSSLGSVVPITRSVLDNAFVYSGIAGYDPRDAMSAREVEGFDGSEFYAGIVSADLSEIKLAYPKNFIEQFISANEKNHFFSFIEKLKSLGAQLFEVEIENADKALNAHYIIEAAEGTTNLARLDGVHFGFRTPDYTDLNSLYKNTRCQGFGSEVKRRILAGNHFLTGENYRDYYKQALKVRGGLKRDILATLSKFDAVIMPCFSDGEAENSLLHHVKKDRFLAIASLVGTPSLAFPYSKKNEKKFFGAQLIGRPFDEKKLYSIGAAIEKERGGK